MFYPEGVWREDRGTAQLNCGWFVTEHYSREDGLLTPLYTAVLGVKNDTSGGNRFRGWKTETGRVSQKQTLRETLLTAGTGSPGVAELKRGRRLWKIPEVRGNSSTVLSCPADFHTHNEHTPVCACTYSAHTWLRSLEAQHYK